MDFAYDNGCEALALTDHGNMNGFAYQVLHAKKMKAAGKNFKPIFGVEAYFIPSVEEWKVKIEEYRQDKKKAKQIDDDQSGTNIEADGESKGMSKSDINRTRHLVLIAMNQTGLNNIFKMVSESYNGDYFYRKPRVDYDLLSCWSVCASKPERCKRSSVIVGTVSFNGMQYRNSTYSTNISFVLPRNSTSSLYQQQTPTIRIQRLGKTESYISDLVGLGKESPNGLI
jgi:DNA polymerase III alpha subunit (gram-positive type)